ncbi:MAG TPA: hypothetical protein VHP38_16780, partial [Ruminiclostridium sp.]|nr:hypothetical protein [Ruminiclostridium sp.]
MEYLENIKLTSLQGVMGIVTFLMFFGAIAFLISHIKKRHKLYNKIADKTKTDEAGNEKRISFNDALNITKSRLRNEFVASVNHDMLMFGTILFTLCLMFIIIQLIVKVLFGAVFFKGIFYNVHSVIFNISITLIFLGSLIAILRRASGLNPRLERSREHFMPLVSLLIVP